MPSTGYEAEGLHECTNLSFYRFASPPTISIDAYHFAIARADGINSFVTLDQGFGVIDTLNLYTCDLALLQNQTTATEILPSNQT